MNAKKLERLPTLAAVLLVVLVLAACAVRLRSDEGQIPVSGNVASDPLTTKLAACRSVTYEQKDALYECRKAWAEKHRQFLGQKAPAASDGGPSQAGPLLVVAPKDQSGLPSGYPPVRQTGKE